MNRKKLLFLSLSFIMTIILYVALTSATYPKYVGSKLHGTGKDTTALTDIYLEFKGTVKKSKVNELDESLPLDSTLITISVNNIIYSQVWTNKKGKVIFRIPLEGNYKISVSKKGYVSKFFEVNARVPTTKKKAFTFVFDIDIFEEIEGIDVSVLRKPIAKVAYNVINDQFEYDSNYTSRINFDLKKMYMNYYMVQKTEADSLANKEPK